MSLCCVFFNNEKDVNSCIVKSLLYLSDSCFLFVSCGPVLAKGGESVTLNTEVKVQKGSELEWMLDDNTVLVTGMNGDDRETKYSPDERFKDRLKMNPQTGDLIITDITTEHNGLYKLQKISSDGKIPYRMFSVCVIGEKLLMYNN